MQGIQEIARNLLNLEVNTIICDGMTAEKMPGAADAMVDIGQQYQRFLRQRAEELRAVGLDIDSRLPAIRAGGTMLRFDDWHVETADLATFEALRRVATCCIATADPSRLHWTSEQVILDRIRRNSDQIKAIFQSLGQDDIPTEAKLIEPGAGSGRAAAADARRGGTAPALQLNQDDMVKLRKIWEISVEVVVMQTVVQIDGDVFSRVQAGWDGAENQGMHDLHRQAVEISFEHWAYLFKAVAEVATAVFQDFFRRSA